MRPLIKPLVRSNFKPLFDFLEPVESDTFLDENGAMYNTSVMDENSELWSEQ